MQNTITMKYAFNSASAPHLALPALLAAASRYGYDGVEIRSGVGHAHGIEASASVASLAEARSMAAASGITLTALGVSTCFTQAERVADSHDVASRAIAVAQGAGIPYVRLFCGRLPAGCTHAQAVERVGESLASLAAVAAGSGVQLLLETHDDWSAPSSIAELLQQVAHPAVGVLWDVLHTQLEGAATPAETVSVLGSAIRHVHVHDGLQGPKRVNGHPLYCSIGSGVIDHTAVMSALYTVGYTGYLSGEWYEWEDHELHLPRELAALRQAEQEARRLKKEGEWGSGI